MPKLLLEDVYQFVPDRVKLTERLATPAGRSFPFKLPGILSECDVVNGNNRIYPESVWQKNVLEGSPLRKRIADRSAFGLIEHPKDGVVSLASPICWMVTDVRMEGKKVGGEITFVNTAEGHKMLALVEAGYNPLVSSRGFGSLIKRGDNVDVVQDDYVCEGWDGVYNPSFANARLNGTLLTTPEEAKQTPVREEPAVKGRPTAKELFAAMNGYMNDGLLRAESIRLEGDKVVVDNKSIVETTLPAPIATVQPQEKPKENKMEKLTAIREALNSLRAVDPSKLTPERLASGLTRLQGLHRDAATYLAEDTKASWDVDQLHDEIKQVESDWTTAALAPKLEAAKLTEAQGKVIKALHATAELALKYRTRLGEALKDGITAKKDRATAVERGKGWMERAKNTEETLSLTTRRLDLCYEGLDEFTRRYNEDVTALGKRVLVLEFKEKVDKDTAIKEAIEAAEKPAELVTIREQLEGKLDAEGNPVEKPVAAAVAVKVKPEDKKGAAEVKVESRVSESVETKVTIAPVAGSKAAPVETKLTGFKRPFSIAESVGIGQRLSAAYKADRAIKEDRPLTVPTS